MTTRIGLISDIHSATAPLQQALRLFDQHHVDIIICAGDIAGYGEDELTEVIGLLRVSGCLVIAGNHDEPGELINLGVDEALISDFFIGLPDKLQLLVETKRLHVVHAHPPDARHGGIKLLDTQGQVDPLAKAEWSEALRQHDYDILIVGHTHQVFAEYLGSKLVVNPGSTLFNHSCMILELPQMKVHIHALSGKQINSTWNWGIYNREHV